MPDITRPPERSFQLVLQDEYAKEKLRTEWLAKTGSTWRDGSLLVPVGTEIETYTPEDGAMRTAIDIAMSVWNPFPPPPDGQLPLRYES